MTGRPVVGEKLVCKFNLFLLFLGQTLLAAEQDFLKLQTYFFIRFLWHFSLLAQDVVEITL